NPRVCRIERQVDRAGVAIDEEDALPRLAAVFAAIDAARLVRAEGMTHRRDVHELGIRRMDADARDVARVLEPDVRPRFSGVGRLPHPFAVRDVAANGLLATAGVD